MTKIKIIKKKLNLDIRKSKSPRKKLKIVIKIKFFKKKLNINKTRYYRKKLAIQKSSLSRKNQTKV